MAVDVSLILVCYGSSRVAGRAMESFRAEVEACRLTGEIVLVDHSEDPDERRVLSALGPDHLIVQPNRGYAAGINRGVRASGGDVVVFGNPDVVFHPGSVQSLLDALGRGFGVVAPQLMLGKFLIPPPEVQTPCEELRRWVAGRSRRYWERYLKREVSRALEIWLRDSPVPVTSLAGALLACSRVTFDQIGEWDRGYFLYYEDIEWIRRALRLGVSVAAVPSSRVTHVWAHAADPNTSLHHARMSRRRFFRTQFGIGGVLTGLLTHGPSPLVPRPFSELEGVRSWDVLWLVSPSHLGVPAAFFPGDRAMLLDALNELGRIHGRELRYTVLAVENETLRYVGAWWWDYGTGEIPHP